ncbi:MAG: tRNA 2-thiocytidine biosynthesis protein TtcA [Clostridiales bacterium]|jgi:tRNA(Ile)-lysidine synthase TilS/MesJ|nr:tRNA 2-thiocytidine biosynthesis protein TtcA [Clostridiales bacterium]
MRTDNSELTFSQAVERSIITKYRKPIWRAFIKGIQNYKLILKGDRIAVCLSGGKDSMLMAKCLQELNRYSHVIFDLVFLVMDPGYSAENRLIIEENAKRLDIPITIFETGIYDAVVNAGDGACYLCARMRRGYLYKQARVLGCNKIALGHHYDDVIETILMSMFYGGEIRTMLPKLKSTNFEGMELIRPLYLVREEAIITWRNYHRLKFINCACRFQENCLPEGQGAGKRAETKKLIKTLRTQNPVIEKNIFKSVENVQMDSVVGFKKQGTRHSFLDEY